MTFKPHLLVPLALLGVAAAPARFTAPMQPWTSSDGQVSLLQPAAAQFTTSGESLSTLMSPGWRLIWGGDHPTSGRMIVRLTLKVVPHKLTPGSNAGTATEVFQVGVSRDPAVVRSCLRHGLDGGSGGRKPDRVINGVRYVAWDNGDAGMSSGIGGTDLRAVVDGACYAVERFGVSESASDGDPSVKLAQARGAAELDATLASLRIGHGVAQVPALRMLPGVVAR